MGVRSLRHPFFISVLLHALLLFLWVYLLPEHAAEKKSKSPTFVEIEALPKKKETSEDKRHRVVQTAPGEKVDTAKPDSFLGWQNQVVDRQTVSKNRSTVMGSVPSRPKARPKSSNLSKTKDLSQFGVKISPPSRESDIPEWVTPGVRPEDYVDGLQESDRTALNTREFVFYGYFQRIRERLDRAWIPILREKLVRYYRSGRQLASDMDHTTKLVVILNGKGEIVRVQMMGESGIRDLDDAAVGAFNKAGPFPNPPKGIVDSSGEIKIPWDFVLKT